MPVALATLALATAWPHGRQRRQLRGRWRKLCSRRMSQSHVFTLVLAGGSGTRFWPASRKSRPKQVLGMGPDPSQSLIAHTLRRVASLCPQQQMIVATGEALVDVTRQALPELGAESFIAEPIARNTAPCIAWGAQLIARRDPNAVVMVLPSDHHIADEAEFCRVLQRALDSAAAGTITTVGITPTRPETGYGYIEAERELAPGIRAVVALRGEAQP